MLTNHNDYEIDDNLARLDFTRIHNWLANSYWSPGVSRETCERAAKFSSCVVGAYINNEQVGYLRIISDRATFAWIADVFVDEAHRGNGVGKAMLRFALAHPEHQRLRKWALATRDAHDVYRSVGFETLDHPDRWMLHRPTNAPKSCDQRPLT